MGAGKSWRDYIFYEAPTPQHGTQPLYALRTAEWKLIQTFEGEDPEKLIVEELYNIKHDPHEKHNLISKQSLSSILNSLRKKISWS
ncbi:MAG: DUF4976 domain-containing protein, partial [Bacteroidetes bacterium]|nr:DUF4976 domain-containing protein [Bacteroidota bacterium]